MIMVLLFWVAGGVLAQASTTCPDITDREGNWQAQQMRFRNGVCSLSLENRNDFSKRASRSFSWTDQGMFMVFLNIENGSGRNSQTTGARSFYLLPPQSPKLNGVGPKNLSYDIGIGSDISFSFLKTDESITAIEGCESSIQPQVSWSNRGGVELKKCEGKILVDLGLRRGNTPELEKNRTAKLTDPSGRSCELKVRDLFNYPEKDEAVLKYKTEEDLMRFLRSQASCSSLSLNVGQGGRKTEKSSLPSSAPRKSGAQ